MFDLSANVIRIVLDGSSAADGKAAFDANLSILDRFTYPLFSYEGNFSDEKNFSASLFTATTGVPLVPGLAPVEVSASIVGQLGYLVSGMVLAQWNRGARAAAGISVLVSAQAHVGAAGIASARVEGQLELLTISLPIQGRADVRERRRRAVQLGRAGGPRRGLARGRYRGHRERVRCRPLPQDSRGMGGLPPQHDAHDERGRGHLPRRAG